MDFLSDEFLQKYPNIKKYLELRKNNPESVTETFNVLDLATSHSEYMKHMREFLHENNSVNGRDYLDYALELRRDFEKEKMMTNETKFSITHFTKEEFSKYKEMHEDENTKIHKLIIAFGLDPYKEVGHIERHKSHFCMVTAVKEDVKSGEVKIFEEIFEKFETQEQLTFEVYGYSGDARLRGEELKVNCKNILVKGVYQTVETSFFRNVLGKIERFYYVVVHGKLLDDDFEKEQPNDEKKNIK